MVVRYSARRKTDTSFCSVCDGRGHQEPILLCVDCVHPERVRTYCSSCKLRMNFSLKEAQTLFNKMNLELRYTGIVLLFHGCPTCMPDGGSVPEMYELDDQEILRDLVA